MHHHPLRGIAPAIVENDAINSDHLRPVLLRNLRPALRTKRRKVEIDRPSRVEIIRMDLRDDDSMLPRGHFQIVGSTVIWLPSENDGVLGTRTGCDDPIVLANLDDYATRKCLPLNLEIEWH
jgi:hypothetical protein